MATFARLIETAPISTESVPLLLALYKHLKENSKLRRPFLVEVQQLHPDDFWANLALGDLMGLENNHAESIRYYQAALAVHPRAAVAHHNMAVTLMHVGRMDEAVEQFRKSLEIDPTAAPSSGTLAIALSKMERHEEAIEQFRVTLRMLPNPASSKSQEASLRFYFGESLKARGRFAEAADQIQQAAALDLEFSIYLNSIRAVLWKQGRVDEMRAAWNAEIEARPDRHESWSGYAEFLLFAGKEDEYRRVRRRMLDRFESTRVPQIAERTGRACLLLPGTEDEQRRAAALIDRAVNADKSTYPNWAYSYFLVAKSLAEYRLGRWDSAISMLSGPANRPLMPVPDLILAMAQYRRGRKDEAVKTLAKAVFSYDWRAAEVNGEDGWMYHVLRREAEATVLPNLPAFLEGKYQPGNNDERKVLLGICQFENRTNALAHLYADIFAADPKLAEDRGAGHRYKAARAAAQSGYGRGADAAGLAEPQRAQWRQQARSWLRADLKSWNAAPISAPATREKARLNLTRWPREADLAGLRETAELNELPPEERKDCLALWNEHAAALRRIEEAK